VTCIQSTKRLQGHLPDTRVVDYLAWRRSSSIRGVARERIDILLALARKAFPKDRALSRRYVELARLIGMKAGVRLSKEEKMSICRGCGTLLVPGESCRVRTRSELGTTVLITCLECGAKKRYPSVRERHSRRKS
jgi:ribonuclease P protein subunit RPR2